MRKVMIGVLAAAMVLAACGGSSKNTPAASGGSGGTTAKSGGSDTTTGGGSSDNSDLSKLAGQFAKAKIKITYSSSSSPGSSITISQDGNGKSSFATAGSTFYTDSKGAVACNGTGAAAHCVAVGGNSALSGAGASFTASFSALATLFSSLGKGDKSSDTIAGRDASCVKYKASDFVGKLAAIPLFKGAENPSDYNANDTATICIDKKTGFVLKISGTKKGAPQDEFVATAVGDPTDSDFTPPVTPETMPAGLTVPTTPGG